MESREGINSRSTMMALGAQSNYHVAPRTENSTPVAVMPQADTNHCAANGGSAGTSEKKKRGRPRKSVAGTNSGASSRVPLSSSAPSGNVLPEEASGARPYTSQKKQKTDVENTGEVVSCSTGGRFLPHMLIVNAGEDVSAKIISFCQQGPRSVCIMSAIGLISSATLRQPEPSGATLTYEGIFEILSLRGSFLSTELEGNISRGGAVNITMASSDGRIIAGTVAGVLIAASPVQVVMASFLPSNDNESMMPMKQKPQAKSSTPPTATNDASNTEHHQYTNAHGQSSSIPDIQGFAPSGSFQVGVGARASAMGGSRNSNGGVNISFLGQ